MSYISPQDLGTVLPRWRCHKIVQAAKIVDVLFRPLRLRLDVPPPNLTNDRDQNESWFQPRPDIASRHTPEPGDYLVRYDDGYLSVSPAKAFEDGYTLLSQVLGDARTAAEYGAQDGSSYAGEGNSLPINQDSADSNVNVHHRCDRMFSHTGSLQDAERCALPQNHQGPHRAA